MSVDDETMQILARTAQLAGHYGQPKEAGEIVDALSRFSPADEGVKLLRASTYLHVGRVAEATEILRDDILANNGSNDRAKTLLGMAHHFSGNKADRDRVLQEVIDSGADADALVIAEDLINS